jgi:TolA-binding protein
MQMKTPQNAPKNQNDELTRWLQFLRDDINNMNRTIEDLRQEVEKLKAKG